MFYLAHLNTLKGKIMQNKPNLGQSQIFIRPVEKRNCNEKWQSDTWSKQTQTNPICSGPPQLKAGKTCNEKKQVQVFLWPNRRQRQQFLKDCVKTGKWFIIGGRDGGARYA